MIKRISKPLLITIIIAASAFFGFADTSFSIQYTTDKSKSDSYTTYDSSKAPTFTQNQTVYIQITRETTTESQTDSNTDTATDDTTSDGSTDSSDTSSTEAESTTTSDTTDTTDSPTLFQRVSGSTQGESLHHRMVFISSTPERWEPMRWY